MKKKNYNPNRVKEKLKTVWNSRPVLTQTAKDITDQERNVAVQRNLDLIKATKKHLNILKEND